MTDNTFTNSTANGNPGQWDFLRIHYFGPLEARLRGWNFLMAGICYLAFVIWLLSSVICLLPFGLCTLPSGIWLLPFANVPSPAVFARVYASRSNQEV